MALSALAYSDHEFVRFTNPGAFDWIDLKHFAMQSSHIPTEQALGEMIEHPRFRDHYTSPTSHQDTDFDVHGPYRLGCIEVSSYAPTSRADALAALAAFVARNYAPAEPALQQRQQLLTDNVLPVLTPGDEFFRLHDLGQAAAHDWGWVLTDFIELVVIDRSAPRLSLIVAAED